MVSCAVHVRLYSQPASNVTPRQRLTMNQEGEGKAPPPQPPRPPPSADSKPSMMSAIPRKKLPPLPPSGGAESGPSSSAAADIGRGALASAASSSNKAYPAAMRPKLDKKLPLAAGRHLTLKKAPPPPPHPAPAARSSSLPSSAPPRQRLKKMRRTMSTHLSSSALSASSGGSSGGPARAGNDNSNAPSLGGSSWSSSAAASSHITKVSDVPMVLRIRGVAAFGGVSDDPDPFGHSRSSLRLPKRSRPFYEEPNESDPDDYLPDDEAPTRKRKKGSDSPAPGTSMGEGGAGETQLLGAGASDGAAASAYAGAPVEAVDAPPPGELASLWYSREDRLHIFVAEKICGWKTRVAFGLFDAQGEPVALDGPKAVEIQTNLLQDESIWAKRMFRMEISRIVPTRCPVVMTVVSMQTDGTKAGEAAVGDALAVSAATTAGASYVLKPVGHEEVLLVKWRGRSYMHCSWERPSDIARFDNSNSTAKNKMKRFYQQQEAVYGPEWKKVLQEEQSIHHVDATLQREIDKATDEEREDFFSPQNLEVERILGCDESTIDMRLFARQRGLNMKMEQEAILRREEEISKDGMAPAVSPKAAFQLDAPDDGEKAKTSLQAMVQSFLVRVPKAWDPEDNVRYVVKWKGLPFADMTWEYWRDIKRDAVDEAEDFWHRQHPPDPDLAIRAATKTHPHMREFRKLQESPLYGVSSRPRPVEGYSMDEEEEAGPGFYLRSYQLEGVNWLLFNWWNRRSPILADEMGL